MAITTEDVMFHYDKLQVDHTIEYAGKTGSSEAIYNHPVSDKLRAYIESKGCKISTLQKYQGDPYPANVNCPVLITNIPLAIS